MSAADTDVDMASRLDATEEMIGPYKTVEDLGVGGYSRVKLAQDTRSKKYVAVKILLSEPKQVTDETTNKTSVQWIISDSKVKQCKREIGLMQQIQHKNVVALHDFIEDATFPQEDSNKQMVKTPCLCVVLEYCSRGELFDFLMYTGRLGERATRTYFHQFLSGLQAMHKSGYAHRDLKPENLLLSEDFTLKIADFGFATQFKNQKKKIKMATTCGTKGYLAPELLAGHKYTHKVDLFAVGIIMFTTFAGFPPFQHAGAGDWWWDKMSKAWTYWTEAPSAKNEIEQLEREKKGNEKMRLFWAAHERSLPFDASFKDLMQHLLNPYPKQRFDIDDCFKHSWMKGKTLSRKQLGKYMKQYSSTVRAQRAIKIQNQLKEQQESAQKDNKAKRIILDMAKPEQFEKLVMDFEKALDKVEENPALVQKVRFKFETTEPLLQVLASIDSVARAHNNNIDLDVDKCECKILGGVSRTKNVKGRKDPVFLEPEDVTIMIKIYKATLNTFDDNDTSNFTFDIEGNFLDEDDDDDDNDDDEKDNSKNKKEQNNNSNNNKKGNKEEKRWAVLFYRISGSADGFQQMMAKLFYDPKICKLMDNGNVNVKTQAQAKQLAKMPETARAFVTLFEPQDSDIQNEQNQFDDPLVAN